MTFEMTRIKQRLADLEKNQEKLLKIISEINLTMIVIQEEINTIGSLKERTTTQKNTGKDHP